MKDYFHPITKWFSYNRYTALGILLVTILVLGMGCNWLIPIKVVNPWNPTEKITAEQAQALVDQKSDAYNAAITMYNAKVDIQSTELALERAILVTSADDITTKAGRINENIQLAEANRAAAFQTLQTLGNMVGSAAGTAGVPITGGIALVTTILGGALGADNLRKRSVIANLKEQCKPLIKV